jgi:hypothetical protein
MQRKTIYLARLLGLFTVILVGWMLVEKNFGASLVRLLLDHADLKFTYALIALAMGLAMVLGHQVWRGGMLPVVVTVVGWLVLAKGLVLLIAPADLLRRGLDEMQFDQIYRAVLAAPFALGLYLTLAGLAAGRPRAREAGDKTGQV